MTMHSGRTGFDPRRTALLQDIAQSRDVKELIHSDEMEDFITVLNFLDPKEGTDFAHAIFKCRKHNMVQQEKLFWLTAKARCAVKGRRAELYAQTLARVFVAEYFGGKSSGDRKRDGSDNK